jgi:hypothetical protein
LARLNCAKPACLPLLFMKRRCVRELQDDMSPNTIAFRTSFADFITVTPQPRGPRSRA